MRAPFAVALVIACAAFVLAAAQCTDVHRTWCSAAFCAGMNEDTCECDLSVYTPGALCISDCWETKNGTCSGIPSEGCVANWGNINEDMSVDGTDGPDGVEDHFCTYYPCHTTFADGIVLDNTYPIGTQVTPALLNATFDDPDVNKATLALLSWMQSETRFPVSIDTVPLIMPAGTPCIDYKNRCYLGVCVDIPLSIYGYTGCDITQVLTCSHVPLPNDECFNDVDCDSATGRCTALVTMTNVGAPCDDEDACTENDMCDRYQGCIGEPIADVCSVTGHGVDDFCLVSPGVCSVHSGLCVYTAQNNGRICEPDLPRDICAARYECRGGWCDPVYVDQVPNNSCYRRQRCEEKNGVCDCIDIDYRGDDAPCDDGDKCTIDTRCRSSGTQSTTFCDGGSPVVCPPRTCNTQPTGPAYCNSATGCVYDPSPAGEPCEVYPQAGECDGAGRCVLPCVCFNGGTCVNADTGACQCTADWQGPTCLKPVNTSLSDALDDVLVTLINVAVEWLLVGVAAMLLLVFVLVFVLADYVSGDIVVAAPTGPPARRRSVGDTGAPLPARVGTTGALMTYRYPKEHRSDNE